MTWSDTGFAILMRVRDALLGISPNGRCVSGHHSCSVGSLGSCPAAVCLRVEQRAAVAVLGRACSLTWAVGPEGHSELEFGMLLVCSWKVIFILFT